MGKWGWIGIFLFLVAVFSGRTTTDNMLTHHQVLPPEKFISEFDFTDADALRIWLEMSPSLPDISTNEVWFARYKFAQLVAKSSPEESCAHWVKLAKEKLFPLRQLSFLHAHSTCSPYSKDIHALPDIHSSKVRPWLSRMKLDILLKNSLIRQDDFDVMRYAYDKSKLALPPKQKVKLTQLALEKAKITQNKEMEEALTARLYKLAPRYNKAPRSKDYFKVANDFRRQRNFKWAIYYYEKIVKSQRHDFDQKARALHGIAKTRKLMRDNKTYVAAMERYAQFIERKWKKKKRNKWLTRRYHDSQIRLIRTLWTHDQLKKAKKLIGRMEKNLRKRFTMAEVYWLKGRMSEEKGHFYSAIRWFELAKKQKALSKDFIEQLDWLLVWNLYKTKQFEKVIDIAQGMIENTESEFNRSRYKYWLAMSFDKSLQPSNAKEIRLQLATEDPIGYYGLLAKRDVDLPLQLTQKRTLASTFSEPKVQPNNHLNRHYIEWLVATGEIQIASNYLDQVGKDLRKSKSATDDDWLELFSYYAKSGEYLKLFHQLGRLSGEDRSRFLSNYPELVFPRPYLEDVRRASKRFNVPEELIYAIMRQESAFNRFARSPADAFGLMQLLPKVGRKTAKQFGIKMKRASDLYKPEINIPLGTAFIGSLFKRNKSQFIPSVAAYNASERAIQGWLNTRYRGDSLEFIEDIPYEETRSYVRLVMRNMIFYQMLNQPEAAIDFPQWALNLQGARKRPVSK